MRVGRSQHDAPYTRTTRVPNTGGVCRVVVADISTVVNMGEGEHDLPVLVVVMLAGYESGRTGTGRCQRTLRPRAHVSVVSDAARCMRHVNRRGIRLHPWRGEIANADFYADRDRGAYMSYVDGPRGDLGGSR